MSNQDNLKKGKQPKPGEVDHQLLPKVTSDEIDLEIDTYRDDEIARDKPPPFKNHANVVVNLTNISIAFWANLDCSLSKTLNNLKAMLTLITQILIGWHRSNLKQVAGLGLTGKLGVNR